MITAEQARRLAHNKYSAEISEAFATIDTACREGRLSCTVWCSREAEKMVRKAILEKGFTITSIDFIQPDFRDPSDKGGYKLSVSW